MNLNIFANFSPMRVTQGLGAELASTIAFTWAHKITRLIPSSFTNALIDTAVRINQVVPDRLKNLVILPGYIYGELTGTASQYLTRSQNPIMEQLTLFILGPVFEEVVLRYGIQQALTLGLIAAGVPSSTAKTFSIGLAAFIFVTGHEQSTLNVTSASRFVRAFIRGVVVANGENITEAIVIHGINNFIAHTFKRLEELGILQG